MKVSLNPGERIHIAEDIVLMVLTVSEGHVRFGLEGVDARDVQLPRPDWPREVPPDCPCPFTDLPR